MRLWAPAGRARTMRSLNVQWRFSSERQRRRSFAALLVHQFNAAIAVAEIRDRPDVLRARWRWRERPDAAAGCVDLDQCARSADGSVAGIAMHVIFEVSGGRVAHGDGFITVRLAF